MRILFVTSPGVGHTFPTVPTAWAFRLAGHDVLLATGHYQGYDETPAKAGLQVVDVAPDLDFAGVFSKVFRDSADLVPNLQDPSVATEFSIRLFAACSKGLVYGTMKLAERWRPDLVVHTPMDGAGPLVAKKLGIPSVLHGINFGMPIDMSRSVYERMDPEYDNFGVEPGMPTASIDVAPPSMRSSYSHGWPMRYEPYNGGALMPEWLYTPPSRRRITVTLGSIIPQMLGSGALRQFVAGAEEIDAEFVLTIGGANASELRDLPRNIRLVKWVPLNALLATSDAVIHHGGAGTTLTVVSAGLPQIVLPQSDDQFLNAGALNKRGIGTVVRPGELDAEHVRALLADTAMRAAAEEVATELKSLPGATDLVPKMVGLAG
ncbi:nucleotide disphospho-sugar-binding domain-containing protein [Streptomyces sp. NPDC054933]